MYFLVYICYWFYCPLFSYLIAHLIQCLFILFLMIFLISFHNTFGDCRLPALTLILQFLVLQIYQSRVSSSETGFGKTQNHKLLSEIASKRGSLVIASWLNTNTVFLLVEKLLKQCWSVFVWQIEVFRFVRGIVACCFVGFLLFGFSFILPKGLPERRENF